MGQHRGKLVTPIREMIEDRWYNCVVFVCDDSKHAESTRIGTLMVKKRNGFNYHTRKVGNAIKVYTKNGDWDPKGFCVDLRTKIETGGDVLEDAKIRSLYGNA